MQPFSPVFHNCLTPLVDSLGTLKISPEQCRGALVSVPVGTYLVVGGRLATRPQVFNSYGTLQHRETGYAGGNGIGECASVICGVTHGIITTSEVEAVPLLPPYGESEAGRIGGNVGTVRTLDMKLDN